MTIYLVNLYAQAESISGICTYLGFIMTADINIEIIVAIAFSILFKHAKSWLPYSAIKIKIHKCFITNWSFYVMNSQEKKTQKCLTFKKKCFGISEDKCQKTLIVY